MDKNETKIDFIAAHDWMINEFGFNNRCGIYAIIYRLYQNGKPCFKSKESLAKELRSTKSSIIEALDFLTEDICYSIEKVDGKRQKVPVMDTDGKPKHKEPYILSERRPAPQSTVYTLNPKHELSKFWTVKNLDSQKSGQSDSQNFGQSDSQNFGHKDTNSEDTNLKIKREGGKAAAARPHGTYQNIFLTDAELAELQSEYPETWQSSLDGMSMHMKATGCKYKDVFARLRKWCREDAAKQSAASSKPEPKKAGMSSFDSSDLEAAIDF